MTHTLKSHYILFLGLSWIFVGCQSESKDQSNISENTVAAPVEVMQLKPQPLRETLSLSGNLEAKATAQVAFSTGGTVVSAIVEEGEKVAHGQLLATLDEKNYQFQLDQAEGQLLQAKDTYQRSKQLYDKGSLPPKDFVAAESQFQVAEANRNMAAKKVKDTRLFAPISGVITRQKVEEGEQTTPNAPVYTLVNIDEVYASMAIPENAIGYVQTGQGATIYIPTLDRYIQGKIYSINPQADAATNTYQTRILIQNKDSRLLPGMIAEIELETNQESVRLTIPPESVVHGSQGESYVFLLNGDGTRATRKQVTLGKTSGGQLTVLNGLSDGQKLIVQGQKKLHDGQAVSVR